MVLIIPVAPHSAIVIGTDVTAMAVTVTVSVTAMLMFPVLAAVVFDFWDYKGLTMSSPLFFHLFCLSFFTKEEHSYD